MKIRTKILTAVLAAATAFSCALTASALNPTPKITLDNTTMPATLEGNSATATLTLKSSDFNDVTGAKLTIQFPDGVTLVSAKITDGNWVADQDYKVDTANRTVTLVDVFNIGDAAKNLSLNLEVEVSGVAMGENSDIVVKGEFADSEVDQVYKLDNCGTGKIIIGKEKTEATGKTDAETAIDSVNKEEYFIPAGGVYTDNGDDTYSYYAKQADGSFEIPDSLGTSTKVQVLKCKLPANGEFTTFSSGKKPKINDTSLPVYEQYNGIQFGTYVTEDYASGKYGTLVIKGDYNAFRNYYGKTDDELLKAIIARYDSTEAISKGDALTLVGGTNSITVKKVAQTKLMWEGTSAFQYAVRLYKLAENDNTSYTAVAYSVNGSNYTFSSEIQTKVNPFYKATVE